MVVIPYIPEEWLWMVIAGFIIAFILAFGIGANDVANTFGTSVGAKVLTLRQACILGTIFEILGAVLIGARVSNTIRKGIISTDAFNGTEEVFMAGNVAALSGSCIWLIVATVFKLPVSGTHSIVGATIGFSLVAHGLQGVGWATLGKIVASWFISPVIAGLTSSGFFLFVNYFVLTKKKPLESGLKLLPMFYAFTIAINLFSVFYKGSELLHFNKIPLYGTFILTFGPAVIVAILVRCFLVPYQRKSIQGDVTNDIQEQEVLQKETVEEGRVAFNQALEKGLKSVSDKDETKFTFIDEHPEIIVKGDIKCYILKEESNNNEDKIDDAESVTPHNKEKEYLKERDAIGTKTPGVASVASSFGAASVASSLPLLPVSKDVAVINPLMSGITYDNKACNGSLDSSSSEISVDSFESDITAQREDIRNKIQDKPETVKLFSFLQILTAVFGSFAHGGNDVSNCIGPIVALWIAATTGSAAQKAPVPIWILIYGGVGISVGLWVWGRRVIQTMGENLTKITPSSGFCIEIGTALTVLVASNAGIPISTTHCKVGSIVGVGRARAKGSVDWKLFRNIVLAWFVTLPVSGGLSAAFMAGLMQIV